MDFTVSIYRELLDYLIELEYDFQTVKEYLRNPSDESIILRHDVDSRKLHSLKFAQIQHELDITGTYYFRMVPQSYDEEVIQEIASLGHEIGYHYETMDKANGDKEKAYSLFCRELDQLRKIVPIKTICMHGSPLSKYDNRDLWQHYDYRELGIIGEPYFDLDFSEVLYLTDTGRRWDGEKVSIRDRVPEKELRVGKEGNSEFSRRDAFGKNSKFKIQNSHDYHSTHDIIEAIEEGTFPEKVMMTFHPQRWTDDILLWAKELMVQNIKNVIKRGLMYSR